MGTTEKVLIYGGGAFLLYKLFIAPKTTPISTQANPVYTNSLTTQQPVTSNTGALVTAGVSTVATILKSILSPGASSSGGSTSNLIDPGSIVSESVAPDTSSQLTTTGISVVSTNLLDDED